MKFTNTHCSIHVLKYIFNFFLNHFQNPQDFSLLQKEERSEMDRNHVGYDDKKYMPWGKKECSVPRFHISKQ